MKISSGVFAALLICLAFAASAVAKPLSAADREFVDQTVEAAMQEERLPGVSVDITGPKGSYERAYGVADLKTGRPFSVDDHVRIASITKSFTAYAVLLAIQHGEGGLGLEDKVGEWIKGVPNGNRITVRDLLDMQSGIYDFTEDKQFGLEFERNPRMGFTLGDVLKIVNRHKPGFAPGAETSYCDTNYYLLGAILERATHMSAARAITKTVIEPLGLEHTSFPSTAKIPSPFAVGYYAGPELKGPLKDYTEVNPSVAFTAGAMISTIGDLHRYGRQLANGALLSPSLRRQRFELGALPNKPGAPAAGYGFGVLGIGDWIGHNGAIYGFSTVVLYDRKTGAEFVAAANLASNFSGSTLALFGQIAAHLYPQSLQPSK
jgi:D-alanyl-D-alanine carboxypeptidase